MSGIGRKLAVGLARSTIALAILSMAGCSLFSLKLDPTALITEITPNLHANVSEPVILPEIYNQIEWDRVYIFAPYTSIDTINETIGDQWATERKTSIYQNDAISLLVFTSADKVVGYVEYPRAMGDFSRLAKPEGYSAEEAVFMVDRQTSDETWINLVLVTE